MKVGVFTILFNERSLDEALGYLASVGAEAAEIGTGGYSKSNHGDLAELLGSARALAAFQDTFKKHGLFVSALSCHGNPVHPHKRIAARHHQEFEQTVQLAAKLGVDTIAVLSGCPGGGPRDETPNWAVSPWPDDFGNILDYQWHEVLIPYWKQAAAYAKEHGVNKIAVEMHPGFCVYNPESLCRLRAEVGPEIGVNFDPSHLVWQGIDPAEAILQFNEAVFHVHAKDTALNRPIIRRNGVLDLKHYSNVRERSWTFRTVGYGHGAEMWKSMIGALGVVGYDHVLSVEHEDPLMSREEGLAKAVAFLKETAVRDRPGPMRWA